MVDYLKKIKEEDERLGGLTERMDADVNLLRAKYIMADDKKHKIPDIVNVTLNKVSMFAAFATSELGKAVQQAVVESDDKNFDTTYVEEFQEAAFASANDRLRRQGKVQLNPHTDVQSCFRGRAAKRCLFYMDGDELITDIANWDAKYVRYGVGENGLDWGSFGKGLKRTKDDIEGQSWAIGAGFTITGKDAEVVEVLDTEGIYMYVNEVLVHEQEHGFGFCPIALQIVPLGYGAILLGEDSAQYEGESIFFLIRELVPELNRLVSISQTLNLKSVKGPAKAKLKGNKPPPDYEEVMASGAMTKVEPDEDIGMIDYGDIKASFDRGYNILEKAIQEGSLTNIDIGDPRQPFSAVALIEIGETRGQVLLPRLANKSLLNESLAEMFTKQVIQIGGSVELGAHGHKRTFQTSKLDGEYSTEYKYFIKSPKEDMGRASIAAALGDIASKKYKQEAIMQFEDPEGMQRQIDVEDAERLFPSIKADRVIKALYEGGREYEAELASAQMGMELQAVLRGEMPKVEPPEQPTQVIGATLKGMPAQKAPELEAIPEEGA